MEYIDGDREYVLEDHTSYKLGRLVSSASRPRWQVKTALAFADNKGAGVCQGSGTNVLVSDSGVHGLVITSWKFGYLSVHDGNALVGTGSA